MARKFPPSGAYFRLVRAWEPGCILHLLLKFTPITTEILKTTLWCTIDIRIYVTDSVGFLKEGYLEYCIAISKFLNGRGIFIRTSKKQMYSIF